MFSFYKLIEKYAWTRHIYSFCQYIKNTFLKDYKKDEKVFVIGLNKTGTTSIEQALKDLDYKLGNQVDAELLNGYVLKSNYRFLYAYLKTANAFQDVPFSLRNLYKLIYLKYPNAKYILTIRKDVDTWFNSLESFTTKRFRLENIDVKEKLLLKDAKKLHYRYTNMPYNNFRMIWHGDKSIYFDDEALFDEDYCKYYYDKHIKEVKEFFKNKDNLLILNIEEEGAYKKLCKFLEKKSLYDEFPHLNKTKE